MGHDFVKEVKEILSQVHFLDKAPCKVHGCDCWISPRSSGHHANRWVEVAGTVCSPWSSMGGHDAWLNASTLSELIWAYSTRYYEPDEVVHECVPGHCPEDLQKALNGDSSTDSTFVLKHELSRPLKRKDTEERFYNLWYLRFGPTDLGIPSSGTRAWSLFSLNGVVKFKADFTSSSGVVLFKDLFFRQCALDASAYMVAGDSKN